MDNKIFDALKDLPDEVLGKISFSMPWSMDEHGRTDEDGFYLDTNYDDMDRDSLERECWKAFNKNPHVNTSIRRLSGRLTGLDFSCTSCDYKIQKEMDRIQNDWRNRLYNFWPKYVSRSYIQGELFLCFTIHTDGFVEIDFIEPSTIIGGTDSGIIFHPSKTLMPLFYNIETQDINNNIVHYQIPSIFIAKYPELIQVAKKSEFFNSENQKFIKSRNKKYKDLSGYYKFIVAWDKGILTRRATSYLRTVLEWLNYYENLKKYEIDHKKAAGAYLWTFSIAELKDFRLWLSLSDEEKRKTGIGEKITPGSKIILPPGMKLEILNPNLPQIKDQDTDILQMISAGMNEPEDILTGVSKGTYASTKASRGPMSDAISDEMISFERYLKYDFWGSVFLLKNKIGTFPAVFKKKVVVDFQETEIEVEVPIPMIKETKFKEEEKTKSEKPKFIPQPMKKEKKKQVEPVVVEEEFSPEELIEISFPTSEMIDFEGRAKGLLGVKHGNLRENLGISSKQIAKKLGFGGYSQLRRELATERLHYPNLLEGVDDEKVQEALDGITNKQ